jgi:hypothetical protein
MLVSTGQGNREARASGAAASRRGVRALAFGAALTAAFASTLIATSPASAGTGEAVVASSTETGIDVAIQADGSSSWTVQQVVSGIYGSPAVALTSNGGIVLTAVDLSGADRGTLYYFWEGAGSTTWHPQQVSAVGAAALYVTPSIASQTPDSAGLPINNVIVDQNQNNTGSTYYWQAYGTAPWYSEALPTVGGVATQPFVTEDANDTGVVTFGTANGFGFDRLTLGNTTNWESAQGLTVGYPMNGMEAVDEPGGRIVASGTQSNGTIWSFYNTTGATGGWYGQELGVTAMGDVSMAVDTAAGNVTLADYDASGASGQCLDIYTEKNGTTSWTAQNWPECPGYVQSVNLSLAAQPSGNLVMALIAGNSQVEFYWAPSGTGQWHNETIGAIANPIESAAIAAD